MTGHPGIKSVITLQEAFEQAVTLQHAYVQVPSAARLHGLIHAVELYEALLPVLVQHTLINE